MSRKENPLFSHRANADIVGTDVLRPKVLSLSLQAVDGGTMIQRKNPAKVIDDLQEQLTLMQEHL
jgi:hypothetical protein